MGEPEGFREFLAARQPALLRTAWMLTGDEHLAEDLLQAALVKILPRWERLHRAGTVEPYLRTTMATTSTSWWRRRWRGELPSGPRPGIEAVRLDQAFDAVDDRAVLASALRALPPRQRAVVVLRFYHDMSEADVAAALGCAPGTVKSQSSKALTALRANLAPLPRPVTEDAR